ncbi:MAG: alpha/beta fold hydrolase [Pseudomonadota bacterium]
MMKKLMLATLTLITAFTVQSSACAQADERFYFPSRVMAKVEGLNYDNLSFKVGDDEVTGIWIKPQQAAKATIIYFHGAGGNVSHYVKFIRPLVEDGFQVAMIDFRGYGLSTGKPTHLNIASDGQLVFEQLLQKPELKGKKLILIGASMGSQIATHLAKTNAGKIDALVLDGGLSSFTDIAVANVPKEMQESVRASLISPYSAKEDIKEIGKAKLLVVHSVGDTSIPISQGKLVYANATATKTFWEYEGEHLAAPVKYPAVWVSKVNALLTD